MQRKIYISGGRWLRIVQHTLRVGWPRPTTVKFISYPTVTFNLRLNQYCIALHEWHLSYDKLWLVGRRVWDVAGRMNVEFFTALHGMQTRSCDENSVRSSVRQTCELWQNGRKICLDLYITRKNIYPSFMRRRMVGGGRPLLPEILGQPARVGTKSPILNQ